MFSTGLALREEPFGRLHEVSAAQRERLLAFRPLVALHRAGNVIGRIETAATLGALVETDVRVRGDELVVSHERWLGPLSYDRSRLLLRLGGAPLPLTVVLEEARRVGARLLLDLKLGAESAPGLVEALKRSSLPGTGQTLGPSPLRGPQGRHFESLRDEFYSAIAFTGEWDALDALDGTQRYYGALNWPWKLERFLDEQTSRRRAGVSLHKRLASLENIAKLHEAGAVVLVYVVSGADEALDVLERGADGLITNDVALAEVWGWRTPSLLREPQDGA